MEQINSLTQLEPDDVARKTANKLTLNLLPCPNTLTTRNLHPVTFLQRFLSVNGTGGALWDSSLAMIEVLSLMYPQGMNDMNVLELGSGVGFVAMQCALWGARVIATDGEQEVVDLLRQNCRLNTLDRVSVYRLSWGGDLAEIPRDSLHLVLGSDLWYDGDHLESLMVSVLCQ
jgi:2-polyprenyl-3-methyl-5-hydroxy-6-metoxy-1,4-benzoquinol methylase